MRILVTGGSGFIGRNLIKKLLNNNIDVYNVDKIINNDLDISKQKIIDIYDLDVNDNIFKNIDCIIHLAAMISVPRSFNDPIQSFGDNVFLTMKMLSAAKTHNIKKFIFSSSAAVYGDKEGPVCENDITNPNTPYGLDKLTCEKYIQMFCGIFNIDYLVFRLFNVYGVDQNPETGGVIAKFNNAARNNQPLIIYGDGEQTRDFINVNQSCDMIYKVLEKNIINEVFNIGSGNSISLNSIARQFNRNIIYKEARKEVRHSCANIDKIKSFIS